MEINQPSATGDKDPYALRRTALGILRILIEKKINLDLHELLAYAFKRCTQVNVENANAVEDALTFVLERWQNLGIKNKILCRTLCNAGGSGVRHYQAL